MQALAGAADLAQPLLVQAPPPAPPAGGAAGAPGVAASPQLLGLCCALTVLRELADVAPPRWIAGTMTHVVKALNRCSREVAQTPNGPNHQAHYQSLVAAAAARKQQAAAQAAAAAKAGGDAKGKPAAAGDKAAPEGAAAAGATGKPQPEGAAGKPQVEGAPTAAGGGEDEPEYGSVTWAIHSALGLAGRLLPGFNPEAPQELLEDPALAQTKDESKRMLLQSLILLLTGSGAKWTDASLFTQARGPGGPRGLWPPAHSSLLAWRGFPAHSLAGILPWRRDGGVGWGACSAATH
jgi:hypothetical protein